jgi:hypothetical protein
VGETTLGAGSVLIYPAEQSPTSEEATEAWDE